MLFNSWLRVTADLQREKYGVDPTKLEGANYGEYLRLNSFAALVELGEFAQLRQWKPYKTQGRDDATREAAVEEIVDMLHHVANLLVLEGVTDEELSAAYAAKVAKNRSRTDHHKHEDGE